LGSEINARDVSQAVGSQLAQGKPSVHVAGGAHGQAGYGFRNELAEQMREPKFLQEDKEMAGRKMQAHPGKRVHVHDMCNEDERKKIEEARKDPNKVIIQGECYGHFRNERKNGGSECSVS